MQIDVYHDTVCPWCRIGKRHLELALQDWDEPVSVTYHSFFLNPDIPPEGHDFQPYMRAKGGGRMELEGFFDAPRQRGAAVGLTFNFEDITRAPNSTQSHQLIAITPEDGRAAMADAVYAAYFEHGRDIGDIDVLLDIAEAEGLGREEARARLEAGEGLDTVQADVATARQLGISGVPFFVINNKYGFSGAQPPEAMRDILEQIAAENVTVAD